MDSLYLHLMKSDILWKVIGILAAAFFVLAGSLFEGGLFEHYHSEIKFWLFLLLLLFCGLLIKDVLKIIKIQQDQIENLMGIKLALISLIDLRDPYTEGHSKNVRDLTRGFAEYLILSPIDVEEITLAAELHDIGKIGFPDSILNNVGKLNEQELIQIRKHPQCGADSIQSVQGFENIVKIIRHHHEKYDGTGYPEGLFGQKIPLGSKIICIVDAYDAMIHNRSYQKAITPKEALEIMEKEKGIHFDPKLVDSFVQFVKAGKLNLLHDPVCGMHVELVDDSFKSSYQNITFIFCSETCLQEFNRFPKKYLKNKLQFLQ